jgi:hypothetical protein
MENFTGTNKSDFILPSPTTAFQIGSVLAVLNPDLSWLKRNGAQGRTERKIAKDIIKAISLCFVENTR